MADGPVGYARVVVATTSASTAGTMPVFLLGATAPLVRADLGLTPAQFGVTVSAFWLLMALAGVAGGRAGQRLGATRATRLGVMGTCLLLVGVALSPSWGALVVCLALAGATNALIQPALDLALFAGVPRARLPLAFGVKQMALPLAALLSGLFVPTLALTYGWRLAFFAAILVGVPALVLMPALVYTPPAGTTAQAAVRGRLVGVWGFAAAFAMAMMAVSATGAFYVESAVAGGLSTQTAALFLACGSVFGIVGRFVFAWRLGSVRRPLVAAAVILVVGGCGVLGLALVSSGLPLLLVTVVALGAGWGWNGLLTYAVVSLFPEAPSRASGYIVLGAATGGVLGPSAFGAVAQGLGFDAGWVAAFLCFLAAAAILLLTPLWRAAPSSAPAGQV